MLKNLIFLFGFSTFVTIVWVATTVYHNSITSQITPANKVRIQTINATFDTDTIDRLEGREEIRADLSEDVSIIANSDELDEIIESSQSAAVEDVVVTPSIAP